MYAQYSSDSHRCLRILCAFQYQMSTFLLKCWIRIFVGDFWYFLSCVLYICGKRCMYLYYTFPFLFVKLIMICLFRLGMRWIIDSIHSRAVALGFPTMTKVKNSKSHFSRILGVLISCFYQMYHGSAAEVLWIAIFRCWCIHWPCSIV